MYEMYVFEMKNVDDIENFCLIGKFHTQMRQTQFIEIFYSSFFVLKPLPRYHFFPVPFSIFITFPEFP